MDNNNPMQPPAPVGPPAPEQPTVPPAPAPVAAPAPQPMSPPVAPVPMAPPTGQPIQQPMAPMGGAMAPQPMMPAPAPKSNKKLVIIIVAVVALLLLAVGSIIGLAVMTLNNEKKDARVHIAEVMDKIEAAGAAQDTDAFVDLMVDEMGYSESETDPGKLDEIFDVIGSMALVSKSEATQGEEHFGKTTSDKLLMTQTYKIKFPSTASKSLPSNVVLTIAVEKEGDHWELQHYELDPTFTSIYDSISSGSGSSGSGNSFDDYENNSSGIFNDL